MYDTVNTYLSIEEVASDDLLASLSNLEDVTEHLKDGRVHYSGRLKNMKVNVSNTGLSLKGSLAKYHLDDNIQTLTRGDTVAAIERLSDDLQLPMSRAKVTRIDFAHNLLMKYEPLTYYQYLGDSQHYQRLLQPKSLYYNNQQRVKLFYDKLVEVKRQKMSIPDIMAGQNVLRFELRFVSRLPKQFKQQKVKAGHLTDEKFYMALVNRWILEYQNIKKYNISNLNYELMNSPKDFWMQGNLHWIKLIGQDTALRLVDEMKARKVFDHPKYYHRLKEQINDICSQPDVTETSELIKELDAKIQRAKAYYR